MTQRVDPAEQFIVFEGRQIRSQKGGVLDLEGMSYDELLRLKHHLSTEAGAIKTSVDRARREAATTGRYEDQDWFNRAQTALRIKGRQDQQIAIQLRSLKEKRKQANPLDTVSLRRLRDVGFGDCFIRVAKGKLPKEDFRAWCQEAGELLDMLLVDDEGSQSGKS